MELSLKSWVKESLEKIWLCYIWERTILFNVGETGTALIPGTEYEFNLTYILSDGKNLVSSMCYARTLTSTGNIYSQETKAGVVLPWAGAKSLMNELVILITITLIRGQHNGTLLNQFPYLSLNSPFHKKRFSFLFYIWGRLTQIVQHMCSKSIALVCSMSPLSS